MLEDEVQVFRTEHAYKFGGQHFLKCACSERKTQTRSHPRPLI